MSDTTGPRDLGSGGPGSSPSDEACLFRRFLPDVDHRTTGEVLAHPGFPQMRRHYIDSTMARYEFAGFPGGWQSTAFRVAAIGMIVCLSSAYDPEDRATWPTLTRFKEAMATLALASARQIDDFIARLVETDYVVHERVAADGRLRLLRPTDRLLAWDREVMGVYYDSLQILYPDPGYGMAVARDPEFHRIQRRVSTSYLPQISGFIQDNVDLLPFLGLYQGVNTLMKVANQSPDVHPRPGYEQVFAELQAKFGMSRSHIRNILSLAEEADLLTGAGSGRKDIALTPRGLAAIDRFVADTLSSSDLGYRLALAELGHPIEPPTRVPSTL